MAFDYYTAPSGEIFEDIKTSAIKVWQTYDNTYGYVDEKVSRIKDILNVKDNACYIIAMFDPDNQARLMTTVERTDTRQYIIDALDWDRQNFPTIK